MAKEVLNNSTAKENQPQADEARYPMEHMTKIRSKSAAGFTVLELIVAIVIMVVLAAVAIPSIVTSWQSYRLSSASARTASLFHLDRFTAIRNNMLVRVRRTTQGGNQVFYVDTDDDSALDVGEPMVLLPSDIQIVNGAAGAPGSASTGYPVTAPMLPGTAITFDSRGTLNFGAGVPVVYFIVFGFPANPGHGFRAITVSPMGQTQTWTAAANGSWILM